MSSVDKYFFSRLFEGVVCIVWGHVFHSRVVDGINEFAYSSVLWAGMTLSCGRLRWYGFVVETRGGTKFDRHPGHWWLIILWNINSLWRFRLSFSVQNPDSLYNVSWLVPLTAPKVIIMASKCRFSSMFESVPEQLSQTMSAWSNCGNIKDLYIVSKGK